MTTETTRRDEDAWLEHILPLVAGGGSVRVGPGHDCAVVTFGEADVAVTTDVLVDGVHFELERCGARAAARKALLVNLSDLAAMGATPRGCEVGVVLPEGGADALLPELAHGLGEVARLYACPVVGGDTNVARGPLVIAVTAFGTPPAGPLLTRSGARPGDRLSVTGPLGGSLFGRHLDFVPRLAAGRELATRRVAGAMMDVSDGLSRDLPRLCRASGVGARLEGDRIPLHPDVQRHEDGQSPLRHALDDGEDFELLVAHAPLEAAERDALRAAGVELFEIGEVLPADAGILLRTAEGTAPLVRGGYDHFARG